MDSADADAVVDLFDYVEKIKKCDAATITKVICLLHSEKAFVDVAKALTTRVAKMKQVSQPKKVKREPSPNRFRQSEKDPLKNKFMTVYLNLAEELSDVRISRLISITEEFDDTKVMGLDPEIRLQQLCDNITLHSGRVTRNWVLIVETAREIRSTWCQKKNCRCPPPPEFRDEWVAYYNNIGTKMMCFKWSYVRDMMGVVDTVRLFPRLQWMAMPSMLIGLNVMFRRHVESDGERLRFWRTKFEAVTVPASAVSSADYLPLLSEEDYVDDFECEMECYQEQEEVVDLLAFIKEKYPKAILDELIIYANYVPKEGWDEYKTKVESVLAERKKLTEEADDEMILDECC